MTKSYSCVFLFLFLSFLAAHFGVGATPFLGGKTLKIGIPFKTDFKEFVDVELSSTNQAIQKQVKGYSIDVFFAVVSYLERQYSGLKVSYEFEAFVNKERMFNGTYEELLQRIPAGKLDLHLDRAPRHSRRYASFDNFSGPFSTRNPILWASVVLFLLVNVDGWHAMLWVSIIHHAYIMQTGTN
ncbi:hypothetical protein L6164_002684 [Bauhinia variegata]|uniref:Uncharacterized protein n=1 Tax=Bauhinia variegata TaxID=167791 RepID=A0ACB9PYE5_BAUVA|nr:hypothetical protein L6164_002684 [Bauhinia variegata]